MTFLPEMATLVAYSAACFILAVTPGPDMSLFLAKTLTGGRAHGLAALAGASTGCVVHTLLAALGVSALLAASVTAFTVLKIVGALYLLWLAYNAIREGSALNVREADAARGPVWKTFLIGVGINLTNPKVVLFFVTFLPLFVRGDDPHAAGKLLFLGLYFVIFTLPVCVLLVLGAERLTSVLKRRPRVMRAIDYVFAGIFGTFAAKILMTQGR